MRSIAFDKYEGLGNDFILVEARSEAELDAVQARALCDRRFGIGADGVLLLLPPEHAEADARMRVINADGSVPEMCGNGLRCLALHVARARGGAKPALRIETDAGMRRCEVERAGDEGILTVDMGEVRVLEDVTLPIDGEPFALTLADAGNPHAVALRPITRGDFERVGPQLATHARFPHGANIEFAFVDGAGAIELVVWERGVGPTLACGTGACATVAVACAKGQVPYDQPIRVRLPGGALDIRIERATGHAILRGPARHVFSGRTYEQARP